MSKISTYPSADVPLQLSDRLIGTEAIRPVPSPTPLATKNFSLGELLQLFSANFPAATLQAVLNAGNIATQNITLTGTIDVTLIKPINIQDILGSQGTTFQFLSKATTGINWVNLPIDNLQAVLNAGNTATQNITLVGNITTTKIIPGNIEDETTGIGTLGQVLSKTTSGIRWITNPSLFTAGLADVLLVGNTATNDITLIGDINASNAHITGTIYDSSDSPGSLGQVLSSKGTEIDWIDIPLPTPAALTKVDDINVTLTLGGSPSIALLQDTSLTLGWTGTLADDRIASSAIWNAKFNLPSLTSGSVLFSDSTTIAQKNSNFFWDNTNNRLGIGTNVPNSPLTINVNSAVNSITGINLVGGSDNTGKVISISRHNSVSNNYTESRIDFGTETAVAGSSFLAFATGNANGNNPEAMRLSSLRNLLINTTTDNGGKLQIQAPGALSTDIALRVRNSADTANLLDFDGTGKLTVLNSNANGVAATFSTPNGGSVQFQNGYIESLAVQFRISTSGTQPFVLMTQGTERMRLAPTTGNVLIGTTTDIASAILNVTSTTRGFLPPRMTNAQRIAIATPAVGLMVYCTDTVEGVYVNKSTGWTFIG